MSARLPGIAAALLAAAAIGACNGGGVFSGGEGEPIDAQVSHPARTVLQVRTMRIDDDRTQVDMSVMNGRDREIRLNPGTDNSYILTDSGEKLLLLAPAGNANLAIPGGRSADLSLVFQGALPRSGTATLILNERGQTDSQHSSAPRFDVALPLDRAGSGSVAEASTMANLRTNAMTVLRPAAAGGSTLGTGASGGSNLQLVEALKSELGAVETERGTVISLPGDVTFDFDQSSIRADARPTLDRLVELIGASGDGTITVEGHTDARGETAYNQRLSEARAEAVKAYFTSKGVDEGRLDTRGFGPTRPVAPNARPDGSDDEAGRQRNRRVEVVLPGDAPPAAATAPTSRQ